METVKFISDDPAQKQFALALRKNVNAYFRENNLSTKGDARMWIKAVLMIAAYITPLVILLTIPMSGVYAILLVVLMGIGEAGIGMGVMHDASHGAFSTKDRVNKLFSYTLFLLGSNTFNWKIQHNILHHSFTNIHGFDQDIETKAVIRLSDHSPYKKGYRFQYLYAYFFYGLMTLSKLITDIGQLREFNQKGITAEQGKKPGMEVLKLVLTKIIYLAVAFALPVLFTDFTWWQILIGFGIMHVTAGIIMSTIFQMAHVVEGTEQPLPDENGVIKNESVVHQLRTTSDFARNNRLLSWYAGGLNFQIEHHLYPNMCHIHYHKIAPIVEKTAKEFGIVYNLKPSLYAAFRSHAKRLKELGAKSETTT
ncbi:MAG: acyl-CoA desaturase [Bacteroidetes bacterium]|nr:acyl-CoA desaturase [Bacteroidota bacterium]